MHEYGLSEKGFGKSNHHLIQGSLPGSLHTICSTLHELATKHNDDQLHQAKLIARFFSVQEFQRSTCFMRTDVSGNGSKQWLAFKSLRKLTGRSAKSVSPASATQVPLALAMGFDSLQVPYRHLVAGGSSTISHRVPVQFLKRRVGQSANQP